MKIAPARSLAAFLGLLATGASAQAALDVESLTEIGEANVMTAEGAEVGEVEDVLIDSSGTVVAVVVEVEGLLGIGDDDVVFALSELTFRDDNFVTALDEDGIEGLPRYDD